MTMQTRYMGIPEGYTFGMCENKPALLAELKENLRLLEEVELPNVQTYAGDFAIRSAAHSISARINRLEADAT